MKARQFVYTAWTTSKAGGYSLSRIKVKNNLFYPSTAEAVQQEAANDTAVMLPVHEENHDVFPLPKPRLGFKSSFRSLKFLPFYGTGAAGGSGKGKQVLCVDESARPAGRGSRSRNHKQQQTSSLPGFPVGSRDASCRARFPPPPFLLCGLESSDNHHRRQDPGHKFSLRFMILKRVCP